MSNNSPPIEQQRFGRSQTPESPRPVHVPEPSNIPVLLNQMDPVFNDTNTYNIPSDQTFSQYDENLEHSSYKNPSSEEHDAVQNFFREAEKKASEPTEPTTSVTSTYTNNQAGPYLPTSQSGPVTTSDAHNIFAIDIAAAVNHQIQDSTQSKYLPIRDETQNEAEDNARQLEDTSTTKPAQAALQPESAVDYQSLLDTISQSTSTAPSTEGLTALTTQPSVPESHVSSLPSFPGLPKKPPPLETPAAFPTSQSILFQPQFTSNTIEKPTSQQGITNGYIPATNEVSSSLVGFLPGNSATSASLFNLGITNDQAAAMQLQYSQPNYQRATSISTDRTEVDSADRPWSPRTQAVYDQFLEDERRYVTEGIWDRFPVGSRLFVGNLPSEKVTKRDIFHRFHRHGKLAQISIKQAYGFVQYHEAEACKAALDAEQGIEIRGRKVHLEISKPQKNTKGSTNNKSQNRRRSRSPQRRSYSDFRDEPGRRREEYRHRRSPSPRNYRRDEHRGSFASRDGRRSPVHDGGYGTTQPTNFDDEASLPFPRREPRNVPDVQVIVLDGGVHQSFINWVEDGFRRKGLSAATTWLNQRAPLAAVVKRQIVEGVQAVVKLGSSAQSRSKIPIQVFDRSTGSSNVSFNEYVDLDILVAADIVLQARQKERANSLGGMRPPQPPYPPSLMLPQSPYSSHQSSPATPWGAVPSPQQQILPPHPQLPPPPPQQQALPPLPQHYPYPPQQQQQYRPPQPPQPQTPYSSGPPSAAGSQPPNLHELLANLNKSGAGSGAPPTPLSAHSTATPHTPYAPSLSQFHQPQAPYLQVPVPPQQQSPQQLNAYSQQQTWLPQNQPAQNGIGQQNVQNMLEQLNRFRQ